LWVSTKHSLGTLSLNERLNTRLKLKYTFLVVHVYFDLTRVLYCLMTGDFV